MGIKTESLANACNLSEGLTPDIYIKRTVAKQNNVFFIDGECPALTVKYPVAAPGGGKGGQMPPQNYFLPPHFAPPVLDNFCRNH